MKVLHISSKPIYPLVDGGCYASKSFVETLLHAGFSVDHISIATSKHTFDSLNYPEQLREFIQPEAVHVPTEVKIIPAFVHLFNSSSYNVSRFYSISFDELVKEKLSFKKYDVIVFDGLYTLPYLNTVKRLADAMCVYRSHNIESDIWKTYSENNKGLKKWYLSKLAKDLECYEKEIIHQLDLILTLSDSDLKRIKEWTTTPSILLPVAIQLPETTADYSKSGVYHIGAMDWKPNQEAVSLLIDYQKQVLKEVSDATLAIAGRSSLDYFQSDSSMNLTVNGFVECPNQFAIEHGILATPIQSGSGIRIKLLEAMALGIPTLTTELGALGINNTDSFPVTFIENTPSEFIVRLIELMSSEELRKKIGTNAREYIRKYHNIDALSQQLIERFKTA